MRCFVFIVSSGDLLVWSSDLNRSFFSLSNIVRIFTVSDFCHVGIALKNEKGLFVVEADIPEVKLRQVKDYSNCYCVPMNIRWSDKTHNLLLENLKEEYSISQAILSPWKKPFKDDKWQCVEFVINFYKKNQIDINCVYTPSSLVKEILNLPNSYLFKVK